MTPSGVMVPAAPAWKLEVYEGEALVERKSSAFASRV